jgi:hypothetical protein
MEKICWTDNVKNEDVLRRVKEERNILLTVKTRKASWIGHILCRKCLLQYIIETKIEGGIKVKERRGRRRKQLLDSRKKTTWYWKLEEEALDRTLYRTSFVRGYGGVIKHTTNLTEMTFIIIRN